MSRNKRMEFNIAEFEFYFGNFAKIEQISDSYLVRALDEERRDLPKTANDGRLKKNRETRMLEHRAKIAACEREFIRRYISLVAERDRKDRADRLLPMLSKMSPQQGNIIPFPGPRSSE